MRHAYTDENFLKSQQIEESFLSAANGDDFDDGTEIEGLWKGQCVTVDYRKICADHIVGLSPFAQ